ncbi:MAG TPA: DNA polymerase III subunit gamma/tau [Candidatus Saccharimonadales bacterium]|jgi:DNA polymerase-3 subunit gamma/tau|nr:DNA polymerase III subunit gamma/tau [Candidatus Saccharimonadales bacterium]
MGQALYRKYRPKSLQEVIGQEHITKTLEQALEQGRISHAYLFTGPRGVGKTSVARILAHDINGLPYEDDSQHIDIIEIDAASNRRIDEIRELRDKVYVAPTSAKYKVYIIDEVHMLTREAFNALLKTLEEPPAHVVFILATTDAHKLPETIVSRTQRFSFRPVETAKVADYLKQLAEAEKLTVSDEALRLLAAHGEGSFRDSISLLDQTGNHGGKVELDDVERLLGIPSAESLTGLLSAVSHGTAADLMQSLTLMYGQGYQASAIAKQLGQELRHQLSKNKPTLPAQAILALLSRLIEVPASHNPERALEIALLEVNPGLFTTKPEAEPLEPEPVTKPTPSQSKPGDKSFNSDLWPELLKALKQHHNTLYGVVRMAQPTFGDNELKLAFAFSFHQKRLNESSNRQKLVDIIYNLTGQSVKLECIVDKSATPPKIKVEVEPAAFKPPDDDLSTISNIFGNAELLES